MARTWNPPAGVTAGIAFDANWQLVCSCIARSERFRAIPANVEWEMARVERAFMFPGLRVHCAENRLREDRDVEGSEAMNHA